VAFTPLNDEMQYVTRFDSTHVNVVTTELVEQEIAHAISVVSASARGKTSDLVEINVKMV
jgi:hypothetical protein